MILRIFTSVIGSTTTSISDGSINKSCNCDFAAPIMLIKDAFLIRVALLNRSSKVLYNTFTNLSFILFNLLQFSILKICKITVVVPKMDVLLSKKMSEFLTVLAFVT